jgi:DNA-binding NarL/FixJ family response regulator
MKKLRILIADDHDLVRRGAREVLHSKPGWSVVGEAVNGRELVEKAIKLRPDVAVVDIGMPELNGIEAVRQIRQAVPTMKVLVLTLHESAQMLRRALDAGASAYLLKSDLTNCLPKAVKAVIEGKRFLTPKASEIVLDGFLDKKEHRQRDEAGARITPREIEIVRLLAEGRTNKEIAAKLAISVRTAESHRSKIMLKLDIHSLAELIYYAMRHNIATVQGS